MPVIQMFLGEQHSKRRGMKEVGLDDLPRSMKTSGVS